MTDGKKVCTHCKLPFPATKEYFNQNAKCRGGLTTKCKACLKDEQKREVTEPLPSIVEQECKRCKRMLPIARFGTYTAYGRRYYRKSCMVCIRFKDQTKIPKYRRRYHRKNKARLNEYSREYYQEHRDEILMQKKRKKLERAQERLLS